MKKKIFLLDIIFIACVSFSYAQGICVDGMCPDSPDVQLNGQTIEESTRDSAPINNTLTGGGSLKYEMVSYSNPNRNNANTPLFNINIFNQPTFTISYQSFANGFQSIFDLIIGISIATAVIVFMVSAFQEVINTDITSMKRGKEGMQNAIVGLIIILSTWLIINTINPDLLRLPIFSGLDQLSNSSQQIGDSTQGNVTGGSN